MQDIGARLHELRKAAGLTQAALADRLDITQSYVSCVETGSRTPSRDVIERWARACGYRLELAFSDSTSPDAQLVALIASLPPEQGSMITALMRALANDDSGQVATEIEAALDLAMEQLTDEQRAAILANDLRGFPSRPVPDAATSPICQEVPVSEIPTQLRRAREAAGLSMRELADRIGCSSAHVSNVENAAVGISLELLGAWAEACGAPLRIEVAPVAPPCPHLARLREAVAGYRDVVGRDEDDGGPSSLTDVAALAVARAELALAAERFALESDAEL